MGDGGRFSPVGQVNTGLGWGTGGYGAVSAQLGNSQFINQWNQNGKAKIIYTVNNQLTNYDVGASCYGKAIPISWGLRRLGGETIWASAIEAHPYAASFSRITPINKNKFSTNIDFTYTASFLKSFGYSGTPEAVRYLNKLWANGLLIYDRAGYRYPGINFRFHDGNETSLPDSAILAADVARAVPYRGLMCVMFEGFPIGDFGNTIPPITAEIIDTSQNNPAAQTFSMSGKTNRRDVGGVDWIRREIYGFQYDGPSALKEIHVYDIDAQTLIASNPIVDSTGATVEIFFLTAPAIPDVNRVIATRSDGGGTILIDPNSGLITATLDLGDQYFAEGYYYAYSNLDDVGALVANNPVVGDDVYFLAVGVDGNTLTQIGHHDFSTPHVQIVGDTTRPRFYVVQGQYIHIVDFTDIATFVVTENWMDAGSGNTWENPFYDPTNDMLLVGYNVASAGYLRRIDCATATVRWTSTRLDSDQGPVLTALSAQSNFEAGSMVWIQSSTLWIVDFSTGEIRSVTTSGGLVSGELWDSNTASMFDLEYTGHIVAQIYAGTGAGGRLLLSDFIIDLCVFAGYDEDDIEVIGVDDYITGAIIIDNYELRSLLQSICRLYQIDMIETNGKIRFYRFEKGAGFTLDATIDIDDLAFVSQSGNERAALLTVRTDETDVPESVTLKFINEDFGFQEDSYTWKRPSTTTVSSQAMDMSVPVIMTKDEAAVLVNKLLYQTWAARITQSFRLPQRYYYLDPGDVIEIDHGTFRDTIKITSTTLNGDWTISCIGENVIAEDSVILDTDTLDPLEQYGPARPDSQTFLINGPLLANNDDTALKLTEYLAAGGIGQTGWPGATMLRSIEDAGFTGIDAFNNEAIWGRVTMVLDDTDEPWRTDTTTTLTVNFKGENPLDSITEDEFYSRVNLAAVGVPGRWELIAFQNASLNADNIVEITTLLRGRRGTEVNCGNHAAGDFFVLINSDVHKERIGLNNLGNDADYAAVGLGGVLELAHHVETTYEGNALKPYAPANLRMAHSSSDCVISWSRRSRLPLLDTWDDTELAEATESYSVDILNIGTGAVLRTLTSTTPTVTYTAAQQATDGYTAPRDSLRIKVYQISAVVGRGFTKDTMLYVE